MWLTYLVLLMLLMADGPGQAVWTNATPQCAQTALRMLHLVQKLIHLTNIRLIAGLLIIIRGPTKALSNYAISTHKMDIGRLMATTITTMTTTLSSCAVCNAHKKNSDDFPENTHAK